jgi:hypothetical protein
MRRQLHTSSTIPHQLLIQPFKSLAPNYKKCTQGEPFRLKKEIDGFLFRIVSKK